MSFQFQWIFNFSENGFQIQYLEQSENIGYHNGDYAEGSSYNAGDRFMGHIYRWFVIFAFVFRYILQIWIKEKSRRVCIVSILLVNQICFI